MSKMRLRSLLLVGSLLIFVILISGCGGKAVTETTQEAPAVAEDEADQSSYGKASEEPAPTDEDEEPTEEPDDSRPATKTPTVTASPVPATKEPTADSAGSGDSDAPTPFSPTGTSSPPPASPTPSDSGSGGGGLSGGSGSGGSPPQTGPYSDAPLPGDTSGEQTELSDFENAAQNAGAATYSGLKCGVGTETGTCLCTYSTTVTAAFTFTDSNNMLWVLTPAGGSPQTVGMHRQGINTWVSDTVSPGGDVASVRYRIIFAEWGYQVQSTVSFTSGISGTCILNWIRL